MCWLGSVTAAAGDYVEMDGVMLTSGPTVHNYADGSSNDNWSWNGTANNSTSKGIPV